MSSPDDPDDMGSASGVYRGRCVRRPLLAICPLFGIGMHSCRTGCDRVVVDVAYFGPRGRDVFEGATQSSIEVQRYRSLVSVGIQDDMPFLRLWKNEFKSPSEKCSDRSGVPKIDWEWGGEQCEVARDRELSSVVARQRVLEQVLQEVHDVDEVPVGIWLCVVFVRVADRDVDEGERVRSVVVRSEMRRLGCPFDDDRDGRRAEHTTCVSYDRVAVRKV